MAAPLKRVLAAGTVTLRTAESGAVEVLLAHRPLYDDWTIPKGKLEADEYLPVCATRETAEESSIRVELRSPISEISYPINSGLKVVTYWLGKPVKIRSHKPNSEVDEVAWLSITKALRQVSYADEREVIRKAVNLPATTPLIVLRHAKAKSRANWAHSDAKRPLDTRGHRQAEALIPLLAAYGVARVVSSTSARCAETVQPFVAAKHLSVESQSALSEEGAADNPSAVTKLMRQLAVQTAVSGAPTVVCSHRPVLPTMLHALGVPEQALPPAAVLIVHVGADGTVVAAETHEPLR
jgi:8-oxo-(d)GTP phosphatase